jgi:hypothetical protein
VTAGDGLGLPDIGHFVFNVRHALKDTIMHPIGRKNG